MEGKEERKKSGGGMALMGAGVGKRFPCLDGAYS